MLIYERNALEICCSTVRVCIVVLHLACRPVRPSEYWIIREPPSLTPSPLTGRFTFCSPGTRCIVNTAVCLSVCINVGSCAVCSIIKTCPLLRALWAFGFVALVLRQPCVVECCLFDRPLLIFLVGFKWSWMPSERNFNSLDSESSFLYL